MGWREIEKNAAKELREVTGIPSLTVDNIIRWATHKSGAAREGETGVFLPVMRLYITYEPYYRIARVEIKEIV